MVMVMEMGNGSMFQFDPNKITVKYSKLATLWGMTVTIFGTVYMTKNAWDDYVKNGKKPNGLLFHEAVHCRQQEQYGTWWFLILYLLVLPVIFSPFRKKFELEAYRISMAWRLKEAGYLSPQYQAWLTKVLSSWKYGFMMTEVAADHWYEETKRELYKLKNEGRLV